MEKKGQEKVEILCRGKSGRIEKITSYGYSSPPGFWYDQPEDEWVYVAEGEATLCLEENGEQRLVPLEAGNSIFLPRHLRHRVEAAGETKPCVWLCVFGDYQEQEGVLCENQK